MLTRPALVSGLWADDTQPRIASRLAVSIEASVTSDAVEKVPTGRRADSL
jgi:hypothetical protein